MSVQHSTLKRYSKSSLIISICYFLSKSVLFLPSLFALLSHTQTHTHTHPPVMVRLPDRVIIGLVTWCRCVCVCLRALCHRCAGPALSKTRSGDNLIIKDLFFSPLISLSLLLFQHLADNAGDVAHCQHLARSVCARAGAHV